MAGAPLKHERNRLVRDAILRGMAEGADPVDFIPPYTDKLAQLVRVRRDEVNWVCSLGHASQDRITHKAVAFVLERGTSHCARLDAKKSSLANDWLGARNAVTQCNAVSYIDVPYAR